MNVTNMKLPSPPEMLLKSAAAVVAYLAARNAALEELNEKIVAAARKTDPALADAYVEATAQWNADSDALADALTTLRSIGE